MKTEGKMSVAKRETATQLLHLYREWRTCWNADREKANEIDKQITILEEEYKKMK